MADITETQMVGLIGAATSLVAVLPQLIINVQQIIAAWGNNPAAQVLMDQIDSLHGEVQALDRQLQALKT